MIAFPEGEGRLGDNGAGSESEGRGERGGVTRRETNARQACY